MKQRDKIERNWPRCKVRIQVTRRFGCKGSDTGGDSASMVLGLRMRLRRASDICEKERKCVISNGCKERMRAHETLDASGKADQMETWEPWMDQTKT